MRRFLSILFLILVCLSGCTTPVTPTGAPGTQESGLTVGSAAPAFSTTLMTGTIQSLKALKGKVVLLNFWATWCGPCRAEMPFFQKIGDQYQTEGLTVLAINNRESADKIQPFLNELGLHFAVGLDVAGKIDDLYAVRQYPTTYVIGRDGIILARQFGPFPDSAVEAALKDWLK